MTYVLASASLALVALMSSARLPDGTMGMTRESARANSQTAEGKVGCE